MHHKSEFNSLNVIHASPVSDLIPSSPIIDFFSLTTDNVQSPFSLLTHCTSLRVRCQSSHLKDYVCASLNDTSNQSSSFTLYHLSNFISYSHLSPSKYRFSLSLATHTEPNHTTRKTNLTVKIKPLKLCLVLLIKLELGDLLIFTQFQTNRMHIGL